ncbi:hypothetical protein F4703DRAFT_1799507 [Phycomyces blakesleeanus]
MTFKDSVPLFNLKLKKGKQFNKHIRKHLFHTNHKNTLQDVCLKFHVINCGSWLNENGQCEKPGSGIATFLQGNNEKKFCFSFFGGSRDFTDNNDTGDIDEERIKNNSFGAFIFNNDSSSRPHIGYVCGSVVTFLELVACTEDDKKNNYAKAILINHRTDLSHLKLVCKLDIHLYCNSFYIVNLSKFGSYWFFKNNFLLYE